MCALLANKRYELLYNCGIQLLHIGRPLAAFECLMEAVQVYHSNPRLWLRLAECCISANKGVWLNLRILPYWIFLLAYLSCGVLCSGSRNSKGMSLSLQVEYYLIMIMVLLNYSHATRATYFSSMISKSVAATPILVWTFISLICGTFQYSFIKVNT